MKILKHAKMTTREHVADMKNKSLLFLIAGLNLLGASPVAAEELTVEPGSIVEIRVVTPEQQQRERYTVLGAVKRPGGYAAAGQSLGAAIQSAGGFLPDARQDKVVVRRKGST